MRPFRRKARGPTVSDLATQDGKWSVATGDLEGKPMVVRLRVDLEHAGKRKDWPIRIGVAVPLNAPLEDGLPTPEESEGLRRIESLTCTIAADRALLVVVITTSGMREFVFHAQSPDWISDFHEELKAVVPSHQVQMIAEQDPDWTVYESFWV